MTSSLAGKRVYVTSIHYWPEEAGNAPYVTGMAEHLAAIGAHVTVLTAMPFYPQWQVSASYRNRLRLTEEHHGVTIRRVRPYIPTRQSALRRALYEVSFLLHGVPITARDRPDAVIGVVPSLSGGALAAALAWRFRVPYGLVVQDLSGQAAAQSGIAGGSRVASLTTALEYRIARGASRIAVVSAAFRARLAALGVDEARITELRNWSHIPPPTIDREVMRRRFGWRDDQTIVLHAGNMGLKQALQNVVETARLAATQAPRIQFVLMGDGSQRAALANSARGLPNLSFLPPEPASVLANALAAADVLLVNERASVVDMSLPSKLTSYFVAGRPVVAAARAEGTTAVEVLTSGAGVVVPPEHPQALLATLVSLAAEPGRAEHLGHLGQNYAREHLRPNAAKRRIEQFATAVLDGSDTPP